MASFASRHPLLVFAVLPIPATLLFMAVTGLIFGLPLVCATSLQSGEISRPVVAGLTSMFAWAVRCIPFTIVAVLFTRAFVRSRPAGWWFVAAAAQVLAAAAAFDCRFAHGDEPGGSMLCVGFFVSSAGRLASLADPGLHLFQVAVPAAVGMIVLSVARRQQAAGMRVS